MTDNLRDRISVTQQAHIFCITECSCGHRFPWEKSTEWRERAEWAWARHVADAVIAELGQEWRADCGYDGYARCDTREEAKEQVDDFNAALGDDVRDGEQAMVMHRYVTEWEADDE